MYREYQSQLAKQQQQEGSEGVTVSLTDHCSLTGKVELGEWSGRRLSAFLGVPYAEPPTGDRRFQPPQPAQLWTGDRNATNFSAFCPQHVEMTAFLEHEPKAEDLTNMSEDCLYLNVWTPNTQPDKPMPVMVCIHGGGFGVGYADIFHGRGFCDEHDVVFVSINYRLNLIGFITTGDQVLPGNNGLRDQIEALRWVQKYIAKFGGDPCNVTIFGESAGGMSVSYLTLIDQAKGLFHRVIAQSGHCLSLGFMKSRNEIRKLHMQLIKQMGCEATDSHEIKQFLATVPAEKLLEVAPMFEGVPWVDGFLIKDKPAALIKNGMMQHVDLMIGKTNSEGAIWKLHLKQHMPGVLESLNKEALKDLIQGELFTHFGEEFDQEAMVDAMMAHYAGDDVPDDPSVLTRKLCEFGEYFLFGLDKVADSSRGEKKTYTYSFTHRPSFSLHQEDWVGADHGEDLFFMFWDNHHKVHMTSQEKAFSKTVRSLLATYAQNGVPEAAGCPSWPEYSPTSPTYLEMCTKPTVHSGHIDEAAEAFWSGLIDKYVKPQHGLSDWSPRVDLTKDCSLTGREEYFHGDLRAVSAFLGIPYAAPPVGENRFQPTQPVTLWSGNRHHVKFGPMCPQKTEMLLAEPNAPKPEDLSNQSEDCLYLNVWTPNTQPDKPMPVMVCVHGGGYAIGSSDVFTGTPWCAEHDVVHVSINYRLNVFGFLTLGDDVLPGNNGLRDQIEALRWVQKYIAKFGGDPGNVTIFGESSGAMSVSHLTVIEEARGLFRRAISQSGHCLSLFGFLGDHRELVEQMGCTSKDSQEIKKFLAGVSAETALGVTKGFECVPYVDGKLFKQKPALLVKNNGMHAVDIMIGRNDSEGAMWKLMLEGEMPESVQSLDKPTVRGIIQEEAAKYLCPDGENIEELMDLIMGYYAPDDVPDDPNILMQKLCDFGADSFLFGLEKVAHSIREGKQTYMYYFTHKPSFSPHADSDWIGADHGEELFYHYWDYTGTVTMTEEERQLARNMRQLWVSFARDGVPSAATFPAWPATSSSSPCYLHITTSPQVVTGSIQPAMEQFWASVIQKIVKPQHALSEK